MGNTSAPRYVLRDLPFSARLVLTAFLLSVGIGYLSAMVQLHFRDAKKGELMPGLDDAIRKFHDSIYNVPKKEDPAKNERPRGRIEELLVADPNQKFGGNTQMRTAFTHDSANWEDEIKKRAAGKKGSTDEALKELEQEREGERQAVLAWILAYGPEADYERDSFPLPADWKAGQPITAKYLSKDGKAVKIKSLFTDRCVRCHTTLGEAGNVPFVEFSQIRDNIPNPPPPVDTAQANTTPKRQPGIGVEKLAQSTHVHLLGFSTLYGLTGLIFAFTSWPMFIRCILCPLPLVVQVIDIGCWWAGRLDAPYGLWAAQTVPITGGIVALGLVLHIMLSLFNMYGVMGKVVLVLMMAGAGAGGFFFIKPIAEEAIKREKKEAAPATIPNNEDPPKKDQDGGLKKDQDVKDREKRDDKKSGKIEKLLTADPKLKLTGKGQMRTPFSTESEDWEDALTALMQKKNTTKEEARKILAAEREGERLAVLKWVQAGGPKKAYEDDAFLPDDWNKDQPLTAEFLHEDGKRVKITSILKSRCVVCHGPDGPQAPADYPLDKYELLKKYIPEPGAKTAAKDK